MVLAMSHRWPQDVSKIAAVCLTDGSDFGYVLLIVPFFGHVSQMVQLLATSHLILRLIVALDVTLSYISNLALTKMLSSMKARKIFF